MAEINDIISRTPVGGTAVLPTGEFEGPVYITKPMRLMGNNTTLWAKRGSVIEITAQGCAVEQLRVELTEAGGTENAIVARYPAAVRDVEVAGGVSGFGAEDGSFDVPRAIELGEFPSDGVSTFLLTVNVPAPTEIQCRTPGLSFSPKKLEPGRNELTVTVSGISPQTFLYAEVLFCSLFTRRVYVSGRPSASAASVNGKVIYTAPERGEPQSAPPTDVISVDAPAPPVELPLMEMRKGQRVSLYQYVGNSCTLHFTCDKPADMEIDPYVFLLDKDEKALGDRALVFFGNEVSEHGEARYRADDGCIEIDLEKADYRVQKIAVVYSIYAGGANRSFAQVRAPRLTLTAGGTERISYSMDGLTSETTVVAAELYLYKGEWKISAVGSGYRDGMVRLCAHYGIDATD